MTSSYVRSIFDTRRFSTDAFFKDLEDGVYTLLCQLDFFALFNFSPNARISSRPEIPDPISAKKFEVD